MSNILTNNEVPSGLKLLHKLPAHKDPITQIAWSPDGAWLASSSQDGSMVLWNKDAAQRFIRLQAQISWTRSFTWSPDRAFIAAGCQDGYVRIFNTETRWLHDHASGHSGSIHSIAWSPNEALFASGGEDSLIRLWTLSPQNKVRKFMESLRVHSEKVLTLAWSPDGQTLSSGSEDTTIRLWNRKSGIRKQILRGHYGPVQCLAWSSDGEILASASKDLTVRFWNPLTGQQNKILEGHTDRIVHISFSYDGRLLASKSVDGTVMLWSCHTGENIAAFEELGSGDDSFGLAFHPKEPLLATLGEWDRVVRIWTYDSAALLKSIAALRTVHIASAKIVLVGEERVGKSCIALRLAKDDYEDQDTTHGMRVWSLAPEQLKTIATTPPGGNGTL